MIRGVVLDIDGVLRRGSEPIPGSVEAVRYLIEKGLKVRYLTNNSTKTREDFMGELVALGFAELPIVTSAYACARFVLERFGMCRCLVLGEQGLEEELRRVGHTTYQSGEARGLLPIRTSRKEDLDGVELSPIDVDVVVAGMDRRLTYTRLADCLLALRSGASFVATNEDPTLPWEGGLAIPGAGTMIAALKACSGVDPMVVGKPEVHSTMIAIREMALSPQEVLMVGDRPDMDILAGQRCSAQVALVLTGEVKDPGEVGYPVFSDLSSLVKELF